MQTSLKIKRHGYRFLALSVSFVIGCIIYTIGVAIFPYDGVIAILFQTILGFIITGITVLMSWLIGSIFRKHVLKKYLPGHYAHLIGVTVCAFFLIFGYSLGLRGVYLNPETGTNFKSINPVIGIGGYILIIFLIANWPIKSKVISDPRFRP